MGALVQGGSDELRGLARPGLSIRRGMRHHGLGCEALGSWWRSREWSQRAMGQAPTTDGASEEVDAREAEDDAHVVGSIGVGILGGGDGQCCTVHVVGAGPHEAARGIERSLEPQ